MGFQSGGTTPIERSLRNLTTNIRTWKNAEYEKMEAARLRRAIRKGGKLANSAGVSGLFEYQSDEARQAAKDMLNRLDSMSIEELQQLAAQQGLDVADYAVSTPDTSAIPPIPAMYSPPGTAPSGNVQTDPGYIAAAMAPPSAPPEKAAVDDTLIKPSVVATRPNWDTSVEGMLKDYASIEDKTKTAGGIPSDLQAAMDKLTQQQQVNRQADFDALEADQEARGKGMEGSEKRAKARLEKLDARGADLSAHSIIEAGLAIMSGTSANALTNIGKGASVGLRSYKEGLAGLEAARDKLDESFDKIEAFRDNRADMNAKERRAAQSDIRRVDERAAELGINALTQQKGIDAGKAKEVYGQMVSMHRAEREAASREAVANSNNAMRAAIANAPAKQQAALEKEYTKVQNSVLSSLKSDPLYNMEQDPVKKDKLYNDAMRRALLANPFLATYAGGVGFTAAPAGKVYDLTDDLK